MESAEYKRFALSFLVFSNDVPDVGMLNPFLLIFLLVTSFLLSINPLGMLMPGYLQLGRMVRYASPAIVVVGLYLLGMLAGSSVVSIDSWADIGDHFLTSDVLLRIIALLPQVSVLSVLHHGDLEHLAG